MFRYINSLLLSSQEKEVLSAVSYQNNQLFNDGIDKNIIEYMFKRLETDLEFFEIAQLKAENDEAKSFFGSVAICGRLIRGIIRRRFFGSLV